MAQLSGKRAVVTGSTSGIGLGIAQELTRAGASVLLHGIETEEQVRETLRRFETDCGSPAGYVQADVSKPAEIARLIAAAGEVDILVNNAGIQFTAPIHDFPDERWELIIGINLSATFYATKAVLPGMLGKGWGRIINIASAHGLVASAQKSAYVAAKHGVVGLTKVTALETAGQGVTCNAICPGWVYTPLVAKQVEARAEKSGRTVDEEKLALVGEKHPSRDFVTPAQIGSLALYLCSPGADQMTGNALSMDGGWTAQ